MTTPTRTWQSTTLPFPQEKVVMVRMMDGTVIDHALFSSLTDGWYEVDPSIAHYSRRISWPCEWRDLP